VHLSPACAGRRASRRAKGGRKREGAKERRTKIVSARLRRIRRHRACVASRYDRCDRTRVRDAEGTREKRCVSANARQRRVITIPSRRARNARYRRDSNARHRKERGSSTRGERPTSCGVPPADPLEVVSSENASANTGDPRAGPRVERPGIDLSRAKSRQVRDWYVRLHALRSLDLDRSRRG